MLLFLLPLSRQHPLCYWTRNRQLKVALRLRVYVPQAPIVSAVSDIPVQLDDSVEENKASMRLVMDYVRLDGSVLRAPPRAQRECVEAQRSSARQAPQLPK